MLLNLNRPNVRGIKKCRFCGYYNGNRSKSCKNQNCPQFLECRRTSSKLPQQPQRNDDKWDSPVDPISIISNEDVQYFSVKVADKLTPTPSGEPRDFVRIEERTIETDRNTVIICRTAVCYVDSCLKSVDSSFANCKHIVECVNQSRRVSSSVTEIPILRSKFLKFFSHLSQAERIELWDYYGTFKGAVQQLRGNLFVVKAMQCGNKENWSGLNATGSGGGVTEYVHCELEYGMGLGREPIYRCSCNNLRTGRGRTNAPGNCPKSDLCHHILLLYSAIDGGEGQLREQFKSHLDAACKRLDLHELDLFDLELNVDWDSKANELIDHMITEENLLLDENLEFSDCEMELMDDLQMSPEDFTELFKDTEEIFRLPGEKESKEDKLEVDVGNEEAVVWTDDLRLETNLSVSFDSILTSIIERMNCNFSASGNDTLQQEFVFYVHNDFFTCLSERFSPDPEKRKCLPSETIFHSSGSFQGLCTEVYKFSKPATISRIFTSKSATIILERFIPGDNFFPENLPIIGIPLATTSPPHDTAIAVRKCINLQVPSCDSFAGVAAAENCVRIAWTADAMPTSSHGELKISFRYDYQRIK